MRECMEECCGVAVGWERVAVRCLFLFLCAEGEPASFHAAPAPPQASLCSTRLQTPANQPSKQASPSSHRERSSIRCLAGIHIVHDDCAVHSRLVIDSCHLIQSIILPSIHQSNPIKPLQWSLNKCHEQSPAHLSPPRCPRPGGT